MRNTVMGLVYGRPKRMKTSMVASALPNALWIPGEGANAILSVCKNEWGFDPLIYQHPVRTLADLLNLLNMLEDEGLVEDYPALAVDGMTALCEASLMFWQDNPKLTATGKVDKFWPYQQLNIHLLKIVERARHIGVSVFFVAHEQEPSSSQEGGDIPGGPSLGSKKQVLRVPGWCDFNARAVTNNEYPDRWAKAGLLIDPWDADWVTGDRNGVATGLVPPNVRELLRASAVDYGLSRVQGLEWQDDVADFVSDLILEGADPNEAVDEGINKAQALVTSTGREAMLHMRWAVQDGMARGIIARRRANNFFTPIAPPSTKKVERKLPPPQN